MKRVGLIALLHESNTFLPVLTATRHFESNVLCDGPSVLETFRGSQHEMGGFIDALDGNEGVEPVGIFAARAHPYGPISGDCWRLLMSRLAGALDKAGALDGLLVAPHGATVAEDALDADGAWLGMLRERVGPMVPIIGTLDLHANVSESAVAACDALIGYRTNPHMDQHARGLEAGELMVRTLRGETKPVVALEQLPLCINIERQATGESHGQRLRAAADQILAEFPDVLSVSYFYGFPYADVPPMGASVIAVGNGTPSQAHEAAKKIARHWWTTRSDFVGELTSVEDAVAMACHERSSGATRPIGLLDMGDNVGGGSAGDGTIIASKWLKSCKEPILVTLYDPSAVEEATKIGVGRRGGLAVGGKTDDRHGPPIEDDFQVIRIGEGRFSEREARHGGYSEFDQGLTAILRSDSGLNVMATSLRVAPTSLQQLLSQGIDLAEYGAIVIKGVHAPVPAYANVCSRLIRVNTPGSTCADLGQFRFYRRRRPMLPFERSVEF